ncbi:acetate kinase [Salmonella enterica subsp. enterica]|nr:acetate kinase [Salmonella enterica subsp. enterica]
MKKVLVINAGSSSLKFKLYTMPEESVISQGIIERIANKNSTFNVKYGDQSVEFFTEVPDHGAAVSHVINFLQAHGVIDSLDEIDCVGHRVAHGGEYFSDSALIDKNVLKTIEDLIPLAPTHNVANLAAIRAVCARLPGVPAVAAFDTSFHQSIPPQNYIYPVPASWRKDYHIRRFGFHGISYKYIADSLNKMLSPYGKMKNVICCHLGNGSSICAMKNGRSFNTTMGFTPLAGLMMGTRCGDIDPSILLYLINVAGMSGEDIDYKLNYCSGLAGVSEISNDCRDIIAAAEKGNEKAILALNMYCRRVSSTIAAYITELNGLDTLVFTAGIGENSSYIRELICKNLSIFGVELDAVANADKALIISSSSSKILVSVIPTDEELMIARDTVRLAF